jgi:hypothetical protein
MKLEALMSLRSPIRGLGSDLSLSRLCGIVTCPCLSVDCTIAIACTIAKEFVMARIQVLMILTHRHNGRRKSSS